MKLVFDFDEFCSLRDRLCPLLTPNEKNANKTNMCPCETFLFTGQCKYGLFKNAEDFVSERVQRIKLERE